MGYKITERRAIGRTEVIRINGKGIPDIQYGLGDLYIKISIKIPKKIELDEKYVLEKLKSSKNFTV